MTEEQIKSNCIACDSDISEFELASKSGFQFFACIECGTVNTLPLPKAQELKEFYDGLEFDTSAYNLAEDKNIKKATKTIKKLIELNSGKDFLNIGMHTGYNEKAAKSLGLNPKSIHPDDIGKHKDKADIIFIENCIERLLEPDKFFSKLYDLLNDKGIIYIKSLDGNHFMIPSKFEKWKYAIPPINLNYFSKEGLEVVLNKYGLKTLKSDFNLKPILGVTAKKLAKKK